jgi:transglutaminase-like putative cysteine protease
MNILLNNVYKICVETGLRPVSALSRPASAHSRLVSALFRPVSAIFAIIMILMSCSGNHLINNSDYLEGTRKAFALKKELAVNRNSELFSVFEKKLSTQQSEALMFIYAYMPLSDLADYNGDFFLANVNLSLRSRKETSWGREIPDDIFLHYVLPCRINNENLDSFRIVYYDEISARIKGKDITDAALEINHWCHEKVAYQPADIRTSAPMSTILSARGRCGEESTFTVAALRTAGIPARQVYTPRWAHSDDNHAWVEIWIKGSWYYLGACEPEPVLDRGWFTEPARRAMLVHTKSFGASSGNENVIIRNSDYSTINNLAKYAITKKIYVKVLDKDEAPVSDAMVEFQLYNYAEFYPLAVVPTNDHGVSQFETGLGDLLIWGHKGDNFDFRKISVADTDTLILKLNDQSGSKTSIDMDLDVPVVRSPLPGPSQTLIDQNAERLNKENNIRQKYIDSWMKAADSKQLALTLKIDTARVRNAIDRSMGNFREISSFLSETPDSLRQYALSLLEILPDKDLRDVKKSILKDHLTNAHLQISHESKPENRFFLEYVLNPRIANELLVSWRHYFLTKLPDQLIKDAVRDPSQVIHYLNNNIKIANDRNYYYTPLTPVGVNELRVSDEGSRAICFVAICRSLGIPARLEPGRNIPQYYFSNNWNDVYFSDQKHPDLNKGYIKLRSEETKPVPEYYIHFTLARFENGRYNTLEYDYNRKITSFREEIPLPPGHYMLVTGNRLSDSKILSNISFFDLAVNEHKTVDVKIRKDLSERKILGHIDIKMINSICQKNSTSQLCSNDKGYVVIWIDPDKEPTRHIFNDLPLLKSELDAWGGRFLFLSDPSPNAGMFDTGSIKGLPTNSSFAVDKGKTLLKACAKIDGSAEINLPVVFVTDKDGNILFNSTGYRIGIGEQILKYIR